MKGVRYPSAGRGVDGFEVNGITVDAKDASVLWAYSTTMKAGG